MYPNGQTVYRWNVSRLFDHLLISGLQVPVDTKSAWRTFLLTFLTEMMLDPRDSKQKLSAASPNFESKPSGHDDDHSVLTAVFASSQRCTVKWNGFKLGTLQDIPSHRKLWVFGLNCQKSSCGIDSVMTNSSTVESHRVARCSEQKPVVTNWWICAQKEQRSSSFKHCLGHKKSTEGNKLRQTTRTRTCCFHLMIVQKQDLFTSILVLGQFEFCPLDFNCCRQLGGSLSNDFCQRRTSETNANLQLERSNVFTVCQLTGHFNFIWKRTYSTTIEKKTNISRPREMSFIFSLCRRNASLSNVTTGTVDICRPTTATFCHNLDTRSFSIVASVSPVFDNFTEADERGSLSERTNGTVLLCRYILTCTFRTSTQHLGPQTATLFQNRELQSETTNGIYLQFIRVHNGICRFLCCVLFNPTFE